jgi:hypothetical protein
VLTHMIDRMREHTNVRASVMVWALTSPARR